MWSQLVFHWSAEKAVYIGGQSLLWDARCAGIYIGLGFSLLVQWALRARGTLPSLKLLAVGGAVTCLPAAADLLSLAIRLRAPSNEIRLVTGMLFGAFFGMCLYPAFRATVGFRSDEGPPRARCFVAVGSSIAAGIALRVSDTELGFYVLSGLSIVGFGSMMLMFVTGLVVGVSMLCGGRHLSTVSTPAGTDRATASEGCRRP